MKRIRNALNLSPSAVFSSLINEQERQGKLTVDAPLEVQSTATGVHLSIAEDPEAFWAVLLTTPYEAEESFGPWAWAELWSVSADNFAVKPGGQSGTKDYNPCYIPNAVTVTAGTVGRMYPDDQTAGVFWFFPVVDGFVPSTVVPIMAIILGQALSPYAPAAPSTCFNIVTDVVCHSSLIVTRDQLIIMGFSAAALDAGAQSWKEVYYVGAGDYAILDGGRLGNLNAFNRNDSHTPAGTIVELHDEGIGEYTYSYSQPGTSTSNVSAVRVGTCPQ